MKKQNTLLDLTFILILFITANTRPQTDTTLISKIDSLIKYNENLEHRIDILEKNIDDVLWFQRVGDVAFIDKVFMTGPPKWK